MDSGLKTFNLRGALTSSSHVPKGVCLARTVLKCVQVQRVPFSEGGSAVHRSNGSKANGSHGLDLMVARGAISFIAGGLVGGGQKSCIGGCTRAYKSANDSYA